MTTVLVTQVSAHAAFRSAIACGDPRIAALRSAHGEIAHENCTFYALRGGRPPSGPALKTRNTGRTLSDEVADILLCSFHSKQAARDERDDLLRLRPREDRCDSLQPRS
jgi:hypothetical protein